MNAAPATQTVRLVDVIRRKRDGGELTREEIEYLVAAYTRNAIPDYQVAAWLMAVVLRGMTRAELAALTESHAAIGRSAGPFRVAGGQSGQALHRRRRRQDFAGAGAVGGSRGSIVPMISGRGLGHTGGTLDKLEAIPGFNVNLSVPSSEAC